MQLACSVRRKMEPRPRPRQDTFSETISSLVERKVRGWLSGVIEDMRRHSPVQQWLDSLPGDIDDRREKDDSKSNLHSQTVEEKNELSDNIIGTGRTDLDESACRAPLDEDCLEVPDQREMWKRKSLESGLLTSTPRTTSLRRRLQRDHSVQSEGHSPKQKNPLLRDYSLQSDGSGSSTSSVLNVLDARRVDAESMLISLGFGPSEKQQQHARIPDRFLVPSKLKGISTEQFIKDEHHSMRMHDCGVFGYRGLTGSPHVPPSTIVAKIKERISQRDLFRDDSDPRSPNNLSGSPYKVHFGDT